MLWVRRLNRRALLLKNTASCRFGLELLPRCTQSSVRRLNETRPYAIFCKGNIPSYPWCIWSARYAARCSQCHLNECYRRVALIPCMSSLLYVGFAVFAYIVRVQKRKLL